MKSILGQLMLGAGAVLALTAPAMAADGKSYPATICQYWTADENAGRGQMVVSQFGWVGNAPEATSRLGVVCPIIRDSMRAGLERVFVRATDDNCRSSDGFTGLRLGEACSAPSSCTLRIMHANGENVRSNLGTRNLVAFGTQPEGPALLFSNWEGDIAIPDYTNAEEVNQGSTIVLFCLIAPGARLTSIYVGEAT